MVEERSCHTDLEHRADMGTQERRKIDIYRKNVAQQHGKRYVASGMEVSKTMTRAAAES